MVGERGRDPVRGRRAVAVGDPDADADLSDAALRQRRRALQAPREVVVRTVAVEVPRIVEGPVPSGSVACAVNIRDAASRVNSTDGGTFESLTSSAQAAGGGRAAVVGDAHADPLGAATRERLLDGARPPGVGLECAVAVEVEGVGGDPAVGVAAERHERDLLPHLGDRGGSRVSETVGARFVGVHVERARGDAGGALGVAQPRAQRALARHREVTVRWTPVVT